MYQNTLLSQMRLVGIATALVLAFGIAGAHAAADPALKCQRTLNKESAKFDRQKLKALQKCADKNVNNLSKGKEGLDCDPASGTFDAKTGEKIQKAMGKFEDKVNKDCAGVSVASIGWDGLASQCNGGTRDGERCVDGTDCPDIGDGTCQGKCDAGPRTGNLCESTADCGECTGDSDISCDDDGDCGVDGPCITGTCADFATAQCDGGINPGGACNELGANDCPGSPGSCDVVDACPGLINDPDCDNAFSDATDIFDCLTCVGTKMTERFNDALYGPVHVGDGDKDTVKCQREIGKRAAKLFDKLRNIKSKCEDGVLKGKITPPCPDAKSLEKINKELGKLSEKITDRCGNGTLIARAINAGGLYAATSRYPGSDCLAEVPSTPQGLADALACMAQLQTDCATEVGVGDTSCSYPECGDGEIDPGETCDDGNTVGDDGQSAQADTCPVDCSIGPCVDGGDQTVTVNFTAPVNVTGLSLLVYYDDQVVSVPGSGSIGFPTVQSGSFTLVANDVNYATRLILTDPLLGAGGGIPSGAAATIAMDTCQGAPAPTGADFSCFVVSAADLSFASTGATCSVSVP